MPAVVGWPGGGTCGGIAPAAQRGRLSDRNLPIADRPDAVALLSLRAVPLIGAPDAVRQ
jgi:hypothetical protein